jgi:KDO2-lipid IV(A) lauroyltransferase
MARKPRNRYVDWAVYVAVRLTIFAVQAMPLRVALGFGSWLAYVAYILDKRHREVARENLRHAFPERCSDPMECDRLVRQCYKHFCTMAIEIVWIPRKLNAQHWRRMFEFDGLPQLAEKVLGDRALMLVTPHFGNWEVAGYLTGVLGLKTFAIARTLDNPHMNRFFMRFRQKTGQTILNKTGDFDRITGVLESKGTIVTLGDQDAGEKGLFVEFFNRPASTHKAVALLSLQHDAPMVVVGVARVGTPMKFKCFVEDIIDPRDYKGRRTFGVKEITIRFTKAFERLVIRHPEQYFWLHRRWKHQPKTDKIAAKEPGQPPADQPKSIA